MKAALAVLLLAVSPAAAGDLKDIKAAGTLRVLAVVVNQDDIFMSDKPGVGFDREVLEGFCGLQRLRLELVPAWWSSTSAIRPWTS
jgi:hypothetical protein